MSNCIRELRPGPVRLTREGPEPARRRKARPPRPRRSTLNHITPADQPRRPPSARPPASGPDQTTRDTRMSRLPLTRAALAAGLLWATAQVAAAQPPVAPQTQKINELIAKGWESAGIKRPAAKATDHEFIRRVFIDLLGRIPTPEEVVDFEMDRSPEKRAKLVQRLLYETEYKPKGRNGAPVSYVNS